MARHFTVTLTSGTNSGPYTIYHTSIDSNNIATIYGTSDLAENLTLTQVQNGVLVSVPDNATSVFLVNTNPLVQSDCPTYFVEYPLTANPTSTPFPTATNDPTPTPSLTETLTPTPSPTADTPTPTPSTTADTPTPTPSLTETLTPTPSPTADTPTPTPSTTVTLPPTPTPSPTAQISGTCYNVWVSPEVDTARTGLRWNNPENGLTNQVFGSMLSVPYTYNNQEGFVVSVCSTLFPSVWDQQSNTTTPIDGVLTVALGNGGVCTKDNECVFNPEPTETPIPTATSTPTLTPVGYCEFVEVDNDAPMDSERFGLRWNHPVNGIEQSTFNQMMSYDTGTSQIFGVCSTITPQYWDSFSNTTSVFPVDVNLLPQGGVCTTAPCSWTPPTATPTLEPTLTPTPTAAITCVEYSYDDSASFGDPDRRIYYNDCDGIAQSFTFPPGGYGVFCAEQGSASAQYGTTIILLEGDCTSGGGVGPTSTPRPTPNPTASPTAAVSCTEYTYDDSGSFGDPNRQISYMDCSGNPQSFSFPPGGYGTFCAQTGTVSVTYGTTNVTAEGPCSTGTTPAPTNTPPPTPTSTLVVAENEFFISSARFSVSDFCDTNYLASTLVFGTGFNTQISGLQDETLYNSNNTPYQGNPSRYYFISTNQNAGSQTSIGPQYVVIDIDGVVLSVGSIDCESGGGDPENPFNEGIEPTSTPQ
jgi:hypothetical protein